MHFTEFFREYAAVERAHDAFKAKAFAGTLTESDVRFLQFLHLAANLQLWLSSQTAERFTRDQHHGNVLVACVLQDDLRVRLLGRVLMMKDPFITPPPEAVSSVFGYGDHAEALAYYGLNALIIGQVCLQAKSVDHAEIRGVVEWLARGYQLEAKYAFEEVGLTVALDASKAERVREVASTMTLPGEQVLEDFIGEAKKALKGRLPTSALTRAACALQVVPGLGEHLWPIVEPQLKRLGFGWPTRQAVRIALAALLRS